MKGRAIPYSAEEMAWLEENRLLPIADYHAAFVARFDRKDVSAVNLHSLRKRKGWRTGRTGRFVKGQESWNKGKPFPTAATHPNCRKTQFRKGHEPHNTRYLGHERVSKDGYVEVSIAETNPHTGYDRRYVLKHRHEWEKVNGPVPEDHALKCLDGNRLNCSPENWEPVHRAVLARLNGGRHRKTLPYDEASPELKPLVLASAKLKHAASTAAKDRSAD